MDGTSIDSITAPVNDEGPTEVALTSGDDADVISTPDTEVALTSDDDANVISTPDTAVAVDERHEIIEESEFSSSKYPNEAGVTKQNSKMFQIIPCIMYLL